jgi:hypothetical protein
MSKYSCHVSLPEAATCRLYGPATSASVRTVQTAQSINFFFACLTFQIECDIFSIQRMFDKVNIPPESGRRDRHNGTGFVAFRALSFLSIFQALSGFWIRFRIIHLGALSCILHSWRIFSVFWSSWMFLLEP